MDKKKGLIAEFRDFIMRGNVMDMAVGVIIGAAFGSIVTSLVDDILMPVISLVTGGLDFSNWFVALDGNKYATLAAAQEAGAATLNFGTFISAIINFLIVALCIFFVVKGFNKMQDTFGDKAEDEITTKECPFCCSEIPLNAKRCPNCTSALTLDEDEEEAPV